MNVVARAVVGVLIRVPGPAAFSVGVGAPTIGAGPEQIGEVVTPLTDTGRLIGRPTIDVSLSGPDGYKNDVTKQVDTLLPGGKAHFPVYWPDRLHGTYRITSCVSWPGSAKQVCRSSTVVVAGTTKNSVKPSKPQSTGFRLPSWAAVPLSAAGGAILMGLIVLLRRRTRSDPKAPPAGCPRTPVTDSSRAGLRVSRSRRVRCRFWSTGEVRSPARCRPRTVSQRWRVTLKITVIVGPILLVRRPPRRR